MWIFSISRSYISHDCRRLPNCLHMMIVNWVVRKNTNFSTTEPSRPLIIQVLWATFMYLVLSQELGLRHQWFFSTHLLAWWLFICWGTHICRMFHWTLENIKGSIFLLSSLRHSIHYWMSKCITVTIITKVWLWSCHKSFCNNSYCHNLPSQATTYACSH